MPTRLICRSCADEWFPMRDERAGEEWITEELTFCSWCSKVEHEGYLPTADEEEAA